MPTEWAQVALPVVLVVLTLAVTWGMFKSRLTALEKRVDHCSDWRDAHDHSLVDSRSEARVLASKVDTLLDDMKEVKETVRRLEKNGHG